MKHCEPAASIIKQIGGLTVVAKIAGVDISRVVRWRLKKDKGGTGGAIPLRHVPTLLAYAKQNEILLSAEDFMPRQAA